MWRNRSSRTAGQEKEPTKALRRRATSAARFRRSWISAAGPVAASATGAISATLASARSANRWPTITGCRHSARPSSPLPAGEVYFPIILVGPNQSFIVDRICYEETSKFQRTKAQVDILEDWSHFNFSWWPDSLSFLLFTFYNGALISVWKSVWRRKEKNLMACLFYFFSFLFRSGKLRCWTLFLTRCWQTLCGARPSFWVKACNRWIVSSPPSEK